MPLTMKWIMLRHLPLFQNPNKQHIQNPNLLETYVKNWQQRQAKSVLCKQHLERIKAKQGGTLMQVQNCNTGMLVAMGHGLAYNDGQ